MTSQTKADIGAVALDLKRVAVGYQNGSTSMVKTFLTEAKKNAQKIDPNDLNAELTNYFKKIDQIVVAPPSYELADDALTYSTLLLLGADIIV